MHEKRVDRIRHLKRQSTYEVLGKAAFQVSTGVAINRVGENFGKQERRVVDGDIVIVYKSEDDGKLYARFPDEFTHDRFEDLSSESHPAPVVFEQKISEGQVAFEDGQQAMIVELSDLVSGSADSENGMFVRIQSWDTSKAHTHLQSLVGKRVRVTVEVLPDEE